MDEDDDTDVLDRSGIETDADLKRKLDDAERQLAIARGAAAEAERRGQASAAEALRFRQQAESGQVAQVTSHITALEADRDRLKREHSEMLAQGDFEKASDLQFQMAETASKLLAVNNQKAAIEAREKGGGAPQPNEQSFKDRVLSSVSPTTKNWLNDHPKYFEDEGYRNSVTAAHYMALAKRLKADTPEYFSFVEKQISDDGPQQRNWDEAPNGPKARATSQRKISTNMPPTRDSTNKERNSDRLEGDVRMTDKMMEGAALCGIAPNDFAGLKDYAKQYEKFAKGGEISDWAGVVRGRS